MIRILGFSVYRDGNNDRLYYESHRDGMVQVKDNFYQTKYRKGLEKYYSEIFGFPCRVYVTRRAKPDKDLDVMTVFFNVAKVLGLDYDKVLTVNNLRIYVDARKIATKILTDLDYNPMEIERGTPFKNRIIYEYRSKIEDRLSVEPKFRDQFEQVRSDVLALTFNHSPEVEPK